MFAAGVEAITEAQRNVALNYFEDSSVGAACPPIKALLHVMAYGNYEGVRENDPFVVKMFTREELLASDWYRERLSAKQTIDVALWKRHAAAMDDLRRSGVRVPQIECECRLSEATNQLGRVRGGEYLSELVGTIDADPSLLVGRR